MYSCIALRMSEVRAENTMPTALAKRVFGETSFGKWIPFLRAVRLPARQGQTWPNMAKHGQTWPNTHEQSVHFPNAEGVEGVTRILFPSGVLWSSGVTIAFAVCWFVSATARNRWQLSTTICTINASWRKLVLLGPVGKPPFTQGVLQECSTRVLHVLCKRDQA